LKSSDVIIIGAGIIGLSTAYQILKTYPALKIRILEKEPKPALHQTGHNSGVVHSGIYYKPGSLKAINCTSGYQMLLEFCSENNIVYEICGKVILATSDEQLNSLRTIYQRGVENDLKGIKIISPEEIKELEPNAHGVKGIFVPQTGIVDYEVVAGKIISHLDVNKCSIELGQEVTDIIPAASQTEVKTKKDTFISQTVVSCAGLYSDKIASMVFDKVDFRIVPFRGEYYRLKPSARSLVKNLIYPVPDPKFPFLGVHFTRRIDGDVEAGPNAVLALKREGYKKSDFNFRETIDTMGYAGFRKIARKYWQTGFDEMKRSFSKKKFTESLRQLIPSVTEDDLDKGGSGVRAQACDGDGNLIDDFLFLERENFINVCNAPSPGATSCFSIGKTIADRVFKTISDKERIFS